MGKLEYKSPPPPKPDDADYMKVWHLYLETDLENFHVKSERDTWRKAFYAVAAILFAVVIALIVLCGSKFIRI